MAEREFWVKIHVGTEFQSDLQVFGRHPPEYDPITVLLAFFRLSCVKGDLGSENPNHVMRAISAIKSTLTNRNFWRGAGRGLTLAGSVGGMVSAGLASNPATAGVGAVTGTASGVAALMGEILSGV